MGFLDKLKHRLNRGRAWLSTDLRELFGGTWDEAALEELESRLLTADVGVHATTRLLEHVRASAPPREADALTAIKALEVGVLGFLEGVESPLVIDPAHKPFVILVVGVNGTGKTTTIGKLACRFTKEGYSVLLAAGDTFRAAAVEQLQEWGERTGVSVLAQAPGADPAAVIYDALSAAQARGVDVVLADTAGRLHTAGGLMDELGKIKRVSGKVDPSAPHETLLVLDASQGQNALAQATQFHEALGLSGIAITKLDGTAKGGILLAIAERLGLPIRFIGVGEGVEDLEAFSAREFTTALLGDSSL